MRYRVIYKVLKRRRVRLVADTDTRLSPEQVELHRDEAVSQCKLQFRLN